AGARGDQCRLELPSAGIASRRRPGAAARPGRLDWFIAPEPERGALGAVRLDRVRLRSRGDGGPLHSAVDRRRLHVLCSRDGGQWHRLGDGGLHADRACRDRHGDANTIAEPVADTVPITLTVALTFT